MKSPADRKFQMNLNIVLMPPDTTKIVFWQDQDGSWTWCSNWRDMPPAVEKAANALLAEIRAASR